MTEEQILADLDRALERDGGANWYGARAIANLKPGLDLKLVKKVLVKVLSEGWTVRNCRRLPEEYVPGALAALAKSRSAAGLFLGEARRDGETPPEHLRRVAAWVFELTQLTPKKKALLEKLTADARDVAAAQASVAKFGIEARELLSVLAWDGSETSADILLALAHAAAKGKTESLEAFQALVVPYARGPALAPMLAALRKAEETRAEAPPIAALLERLGLPQRPLTFSCRLDTAAHSSKVVLYCWLNSREHPAVTVSVLRFKARGNEEFEFEDGKVTKSSLELPKLSGLEALPKWLVAVEKKLHVRWREPASVKSSLAGKEKRRLLDWLETC